MKSLAAAALASLLIGTPGFADPVKNLESSHPFLAAYLSFRGFMPKYPYTPAQASMVCCRINYSNTTCAPENTKWVTQSDCDLLGAQGTDGKKTCDDSVCGH
jgi:hypothetical protein